MELTACRELRRKINSLEARIADVQSTAITARRIDFVPRASATESTPEKLTRLIVDGERELRSLQAEFAVVADELATEIFSRVTDTKCAQVLMLRYVACRPFADIAASVNYSVSHVFKLHRDGVSAYAQAGAKSGCGG